MTRECKIWFLAFTALLALLVLFGGCSHAASDLDRRQREVQDCILSGGHARLGPDDSILCVKLNRRVL